MKKAERFWTWFAKEAPRLATYQGADLHRVFEEVSAQIHRYSAGVHVMPGGHPDGARELVITAEGDPDYFADVIALVDAAPEIPGWQIIAFKPPQGFEFQIDIIDEHIDASALRFAASPELDSDEGMGITVYFPKYDPKRKEDFIFAAMIILDAGIGELSSVGDLSVVNVGQLSEGNASHALSELPEAIARWRQHHGRQ